MSYYSPKIPVAGMSKKISSYASYLTKTFLDQANSEQILNTGRLKLSVFKLL